MNLDNFSLQLLYPLIGVALSLFSLVVSIIANQRHRGNGTVMMIVGSVLSLIQSAFWLVYTFALFAEVPFLDDIALLSSLVSAIYSIGQILFFIGLLNLVQGMSASETLDWK